MSSLLSYLDLTPAECARLPRKTRTFLFDFLIRWEAYQEVLDCLLEWRNGSWPASMQDLQARALYGLGRYDEALAVIQDCLDQKQSDLAEILLGRICLQIGDSVSAEAIARHIIEANGTVQVLGLLGDLRLAQGHLEEAESVFVQFDRRTQGNSAALYGLMQVHLRRGDVVKASAYARRAYTGAQDEQTLPVALMRDLRDFFDKIGDTNHVDKVNGTLRDQFVGELAEIKALLGTKPVGVSEETRRRSWNLPARKPRPASDPSGLTIPTPITKVPLSYREQRKIAKAATELFGFKALLPAQAEIMACALRGENVLAILPTGAGKSLCYKLPAFMDEGVTLVISPLIALMKDQVDKLPPNLRDQAIAVNSSMDGRLLRRAMDDIINGRYKLVYASPERLRQPPFLYALKRSGLARMVIDEAHCVSMWGHDFRPDYLNIDRAHEHLGAPPILAMTATAPPRVRHDVERRLFSTHSEGRTPQFRVIVADTYRPNLYLSAVQASSDEDKRRKLLQLCLKFQGSGIVYARTRKRCEELAGMLQRHGVEAQHYHAGIDERTLLQDRFMQGHIRIIVATIAFGMGVDKPDIRFIIHDGLPDSVESYYQEAGRAGRDGQPAECVLLYSNYDKTLLTRRTNHNLLSKAFLRRVYAVLQAQLGGRNPGAFVLGDAARALECRSTSVRVALSVLEQVGLFQRYHDVPQQVNLWLKQNSGNAALRRFVSDISLLPHHATSYDFDHLSEASGISLIDLEQQLLTWQQSGYLNATPTGRRILISQHTPPADLAPLLDSLLNQYEAIQKQRMAEVIDYASTEHCRHGYLGNYLVGTTRRRCGACDICSGKALAFGADFDSSGTP